jgi:hypothetical protein
MITEDNVKWFFNNMKERKVLPQKADLYFWSLDNEWRGENIYFRYRVGEKNFGYKISKSFFISHIRNLKLNDLGL